MTYANYSESIETLFQYAREGDKQNDYITGQQTTTGLLISYEITS